MTVLHVERHLVDAERRADYEDGLARVLDAMREADGFLWADAGWSVSEPEILTMCSEWRAEADLHAFLDGAEYAAFTDANDLRLREAPTVRRFRT